MVANQGYGSYEKNIKFMLKISKIMPARPKKHMDMGHQPFNLLHLKILNIVVAVQVFAP